MRQGWRLSISFHSQPSSLLIDRGEQGNYGHREIISEFEQQYNGRCSECSKLEDHGPSVNNVSIGKSGRSVFLTSPEAISREFGGGSKADSPSTVHHDARFG